MPGAGTADMIREKLTRGVTPVHLEVVDESHLHASHAGARAGGGHYGVTVVSHAFEGLGAAARHRLIYQLLAPEMGAAIHALALRTLTPSEWRRGSKGSGTTPAPR